MQEAFLRFHREEEVDAPKAFLTTVVTRLAIDHLRSARVRREAYVGAVAARAARRGARRRASAWRTTRRCRSRSWRCWSGSRRSSARSTCCTTCSATRTTRSPTIVGKSSANCRQILVRARRHVDAGRPRFEPSRERREALLDRFLAAVRLGDVDGLVGMLAADAVHYADGGGKARATLLPIYGAAKIARLWARLGTDSDRVHAAPGRRQRPARRGGLRRRTASWWSCSRSTSPTTACRRCGRW